jgi:hypothetical protein
MCDGKFCVSRVTELLGHDDFRYGSYSLKEHTRRSVSSHSYGRGTARCAAAGHHADRIVWNVTPCPQPYALVDNIGSLFYCKLLVATSNIIAVM